jgi:hypothetical protein
MRSFSRLTFEKQLSTPGMVMLRAVHDRATVGMQLLYRQNEVAHAHLAGVF